MERWRRDKCWRKENSKNMVGTEEKKRTVITRLLAKDDSMNPKRCRILVIVQYEMDRK